MSQSREELVKELKEVMNESPWITWDERMERLADFILSCTPPPPSVKWPSKKEYPEDEQFCDGWNACLDKCKELNAPKGEELCPICEGTGINKKYNEQCCCNGGYVTVINSKQPSEKKELE